MERSPFEQITVMEYQEWRWWSESYHHKTLLDMWCMLLRIKLGARYVMKGSNEVTDVMSTSLDVRLSEEKELPECVMEGRCVCTWTCIEQ